MQHLTQKETGSLHATALKVREHIIKMSTGGGCFTGASLSCTDMIVFLYKHILNISQETMHHPGRDYLFLSKGHDVPALYGTFVELGWMQPERLDNHLKPNDSIYWHPNTQIPGIEFHSGSLGHLLSVAAGVALDIKLQQTSNRAMVVLGDGELNEGSVWEAMLVASAYKLDNLYLIIDRNQFQANIRTEELIPLEPLTDKLQAFGCETFSCNGHSFSSMNEAFTLASQAAAGKPRAIICQTIRGKGLPSIAERADRWFCNFSSEEVRDLLEELHQGKEAELTSETLTVR